MEVAEAYGVIDRVLTDGVYLARADLGGLPVIIRALSEAEFEFLRNSIQGLPYDKLVLHLASSCLVSIAGHNVLDYVKKDRYTIFDLMESFPSNFPGAIAEMHSELRSRLNLASQFWEGFCSSNYSRRLWRIREENVGPRFSGIPGLEDTPRYTIQYYWSMYNRQIDFRDERSHQYQMTLIQASAMNPKGAEKLMNRRSRELEDLEVERKQLVIAGIRSNLEDLKAADLDGWAGRITSTDQLIKEFKRMAEGEKDKHDQFIEEYKEKKRREREAYIQEQVDKARKALEYRNKKSNMDTVVLGLTPEMIKRRLKGEDLSSVKEAAESLSKDKVLIKRPFFGKRPTRD